MSKISRKGYICVYIYIEERQRAIPKSPTIWVQKKRVFADDLLFNSISEGEESDKTDKSWHPVDAVSSTIIITNSYILTKLQKEGHLKERQILKHKNK